MNKMTKEIEALIKKASYYQETNEYENMFFSIKEGLLLDPFNYELYLQLGDYYLLHNQNPNQAYLCYENAEFYCHDAHDLAIIQSLRNSLTELYHPTVSPISIVIVSFNACDILKACIESIRSNNCPESYELIIVDNASTDGISEWLMQEKQNISNSEHFTIYLSKKTWVLVPDRI